VVTGPAVIEEPDSTTVVHPGYRAVVDEQGNLLLQRG
jgi:N-methylhydantoinase A/oxoprolinase/acetone carboxylase beta subunit